MDGKKIAGIGRAVEHDKGVVPAPTGIVDGLGKHIFANTALTGDHHIAVTAGNGFGLGNTPLHNRTASQDTGEGIHGIIADMPRHMAGEALRGGEEKTNTAKPQVRLLVRDCGDQIRILLAADAQRDQLVFHGPLFLHNVPEFFVFWQRIKECLRLFKIEIFIGLTD